MDKKVELDFWGISTHRYREAEALRELFRETLLLIISVLNVFVHPCYYCKNARRKGRSSVLLSLAKKQIPVHFAVNRNFIKPVQ